MSNQAIERASLLAWPALETIVYDDWQLRFSQGYTLRANSTSALDSGQLDIADKIAYCERAYGQRGLAPIFKLYESHLCEAIDRQLRRRDYDKIDECAVMILLGSADKSQLYDVVIEDVVSRDWLELLIDYKTMNARDASICRDIILNLKGTLRFATIYQDSRVIACGYAHSDGYYGGLFDIYVVPEQRGNGVGRSLTGALIKAIQPFSTVQYLQVVVDNYKAIALYQSVGFSISYRYWYRKKRQV